MGSGDACLRVARGARQRERGARTRGRREADAAAIAGRRAGAARGLRGAVPASPGAKDPGLTPITRLKPAAAPSRTAERSEHAPDVPAPFRGVMRFSPGSLAPGDACTAAGYRRGVRHRATPGRRSASPQATPARRSDAHNAIPGRRPVPLPAQSIDLIPHHPVARVVFSEFDGKSYRTRAIKMFAIWVPVI